MAEKATKSKAPAARKSAAKKKTEAAAEPLAAPESRPAAEPQATAQPRQVSHDEIRELAHRYWAERGHPHGEAEIDWLRAERELRGKAS